MTKYAKVRTTDDGEDVFVQADEFWVDENGALNLLMTDPEDEDTELTVAHFVAGSFNSVIMVEGEEVPADDDDEEEDEDEDETYAAPGSDGAAAAEAAVLVSPLLSDVEELDAAELNGGRADR